MRFTLSRPESPRMAGGMANAPAHQIDPAAVRANKLDVLESDPGLVGRAQTALRQRIASIRGAHPINGEPFAVSAVSGAGIKELISAIRRELAEQRKAESRKDKPEVQLPDAEDLRA